MNINFHIGLVCCSDGLSITDHSQIEELTMILEQYGLHPVLSPYIYRVRNHIQSGTARERARALTDFYEDSGIQAIFDISGGDLANEILPYLDYETIARNSKPFWGYSDLTTVINAILTRTGQSSVLFQIRNIIEPDNKGIRQNFFRTIFQEDSSLFSFHYRMLQGESMEGVLAGGNIRCLLKLAGTQFWPDMTGKILFLESRSGTSARMTAFLSQLQQMGVFQQVNGILLGNFSQMEREQCQPGIEELVLDFAGPELPVARTMEVGHQTDSKALNIGKFCRLQA